LILAQQTQNWFTILFFFAIFRIFFAKHRRPLSQRNVCVKLDDSNWNFEARDVCLARSQRPVHDGLDGRIDGEHVEFVFVGISLTLFQRTRNFLIVLIVDAVAGRVAIDADPRNLDAVYVCFDVSCEGFDWKVLMLIFGQEMVYQ
jgi:hypothetical protein